MPPASHTSETRVPPGAPDTQVPQLAEQGDEAGTLRWTADDFAKRAKATRRELRNLLMDDEFIAGIGNAYADEILWAARLHPYRKRTSLAAEEVERLYEALRSTLLDAIDRVRAEMGDDIHTEPRGFMNVHMKAGEPCPRCGTPISVVGANQRITNFCRTCQPGGLLKGM